MNASIAKIFHEVYFDTATVTPIELRCVAFRSSAVHGLNFSEQLLTGKLNTSVKINHTISPYKQTPVFTLAAP
jgi:hypothetical protein